MGNQTRVSKIRLLTRNWVGRYIPALLVVGVAAVLALWRYFRVSAQNSMWWDSASFLTNGAIFGGYYQNGYDLTRPPLLPAILALMFHVTGGPSIQTGLIVSGFLYFCAAVGSYLIARKAMNGWLAILPAVSFATILNVSNWSGMLLTNVEGVALEAVGLGLLVTSREGRPRLYTLAIPLLFLAPLIRYSAGIILPVALVYLVLSRKSNFRPSLSDHLRYIGAGLLISAIVVGVVSFEWLYPIVVGGQSFQALFPKGLPRSALVQTAYFTNLPRELGNGVYGEVLLILLLLGTGLFFVLAYRRKRVYPLMGAMVFWLLASMFYYSFIWTDPKLEDQLRYSTEFAIPALVIGFWSLDYLLKHSAKVKKTIAIIIVSGLFVTFLSSAYAGAMFTTDKGVGHNTNVGIQEAAVWLKANVPTNTTLSSNWPTIVQWYTPHYRVLYLGERSTITSSNISFTRWVGQLHRNHVGYVVWATPFPSFKNADLTVVWKTKTVEILKVSD